jgi:hypothetical protein
MEDVHQSGSSPWTQPAHHHLKPQATRMICDAGVYSRRSAVIGSISVAQGHSTRAVTPPTAARRHHIRGQVGRRDAVQHTAKGLADCHAQRRPDCESDGGEPESVLHVGSHCGRLLAIHPRRGVVDEEIGLVVAFRHEIRAHGAVPQRLHPERVVRECEAGATATTTAANVYSTLC